MRRLLIGGAVLLTPLSVQARVTDTSDKVVNVSASSDVGGELWQDIHPKVAVSGSTVHVLWRTQLVGTNERRIHYARSTDGGASFGPVQLLSGTVTDAFLDQTTLNLAADGDHVYVAYAQGYPQNLHFLRSLDAGATWEPDEVLNTANSQSQKIYMQAQGGKVAITWALNLPGNQSIEVLTSVDGGETWQDAEAVSFSASGGLGPEDLLYVDSDLHIMYVVADGPFPAPTRLYVVSSLDDGVTFLPPLSISEPSVNGSHYASAIHAAAYSPNLARCGDALVATWMNIDDPGGFDGWQALSLRTRQSTDRGATIEAPVTLHTFPGSYQHGAHPGFETVVCQGTDAYLATVLNEGGGDRTKLWASSNSGAGWDQGRDIGPGGWWPSVHLTPTGSLHVFNGGHGMLLGDTLHGITSYIPTTMWEWASPMTVMDSAGGVHIVAYAQTEFGLNDSQDVVYRHLAPAPAPGSTDMALSLVRTDETRRDQMQVGDSPALPGDGAFTVELWVKPNISGDTSFRYVKKHRVGYDNSANFYDGTFELASVLEGSDRFLRATLATSPGTRLDVDDLPANVWSHVAFAYDPSAASANSRLYVDGVQVAAGDTGGPLDADLLRMTVGDDTYYAGAGSALIDDLMLWSEARTTQNIGYDIVNGATGSESNLVAYWSFDDTTRDLTGNGHDGVLLYQESFVTSDCPHTPPDGYDAGPGPDAATDGDTPDPDAGPSDDASAQPDSAGVDGGTGADAQSGTGGATSDGGSDGCSIRAGSASSSTGYLALLAIALLARRRQRR